MFATNPIFMFTDKQTIINATALFIIVHPRYILDLNKEQEAGFAEKVASIALEAGFQSWHEGKIDDVHAVFVPQKK